MQGGSEEGGSEEGGQGSGQQEGGNGSNAKGNTNAGNLDEHVDTEIANADNNSNTNTEKPTTDTNRFSMGFCDRLRQLMTYSQQKDPNLAAFTDRMRQESILQAQLHSAEPKPFLQNNLPKDLLGVIDILFGPMGQPSEAIGDKLFPSSFPAYHDFLNTHGVWGQDQYSKGVDATVPVELKTGGVFTVHATCDNIGEFIIDGNLVLTSNNWKKIESTTVELTKGVHQVQLKGTNTGGPASLGMTLTDPEGNLAFSSRDWENFAPKGSDGADSFPGANIIAIPEGIWKIATEQWDSSIAQNLHVEGAYTGNGAHPFSGLSTLNIYSPREFHIRATDTEDKYLNMLAAVKDDAALVLSKVQNKVRNDLCRQIGGRLCAPT